MTSSPPTVLNPKHKGRMVLQTQTVGVTNIQSMFCFSQRGVNDDRGRVEPWKDGRQIRTGDVDTKALISLKHY